MLFRQFFDAESSTYTYLLASRRGGEALIVDPVLEKVDRYLQLIRELDLQLVKAVDTHLHADHITGLGALRDRTRCITVMGEQSSVDVVSMRVADGDRLMIEGLALAAFGMIRDTTDKPLPKQILAYVMQDEARHVAFGRMALRDYYKQLTDAELREREEFVIEGCYLMRDRLRGVEVLENFGIHATGTPPIGATARVLLLAVKPQIIAGVLPDVRKLIGAETVTVSIAAGTTLAALEAGLGRHAIVRTMPNTPAQVGRGITAAVANGDVAAAARDLVTGLLEAVGEVVWVDDEAAIDAVTAVSGSGPAYVFLLAECLAAAGVAAGLAPDIAARLARATVTGAGELLHLSDLPPDQLRKNVTSPNGTTAAALAILMAEDGLGPLMKRAVAAAKKRSIELAG